MPARPEKEIKEEVDDYRKDVIILQEERLINVIKNFYMVFMNNFLSKTIIKYLSISYYHSLSPLTEQPPL